MGHPEDEPVIVLEEEMREPVPISRVVCSENVVGALRHMRNRFGKGYHDLLILFGPAHQDGSVRLITDATIAENSIQNSPFFNVHMAVDAAFEARRADNPDTAVLGIGAYVSMMDNITIALQLGYFLYCTAVVAGEAGQGRLGVINFDKPRFFTQDLNKRTTLIPQRNIYLAQ